MIDFNPAQLMNGIDPEMVKGMMLEEGADGLSKAAIVADAINIIKMDTLLMARAEDVDIDIERVTEEEMAEMLAEVALGEGDSLLTEFVDMEEQRATILESMLDEETVEEWTETKQDVLYSHGNSPE